MNILKYVDYFHDGSINKIKHEENKIVLTMQSSEMDFEEAKGITFSEDFRIKGKLLIEGIKKIMVGKENFDGV